jgi:hypothetical protein
MRHRRPPFAFRPLVVFGALFTRFTLFAPLASMTSMACSGSPSRPGAPTPIVASSSQTQTSPSSSPSSSAPGASASAPAPPPSPVSNALPIIGSTVRFGRSIECASAPQCAHPALLPPGERPDASLPAYLWEERFAQGKGLAFPRVEEVELYGVVLDGEVSLRGDEEPAKSARKLTPTRKPPALPE